MDYQSVSTVNGNRLINYPSWLLLISLVVIAGCSTVADNQPQIPVELGTKVPQTNRSVIELTSAKREQLRAETTSLAQAGQWSKVFTLLQPVLSKLPANDPLKQYASSLRQQYQNDVFVAKINETLAYSRWLITALRLQSFQVSLASAADWWQQMKYQNLLNDQQSTTNNLVKLGLQALKLNYVSLAEKCYQTVVESIKENNQITVNQHQLARLAGSLEQLENEKQEQTLQLLETQLDNALTTCNWLVVKELVDQLTSQQQADCELQEKIRLAETRLVRQAEVSNRRAAALYRAGKIAEAKEEWEFALALQPTNNQIKENLNRATKVLNSLNRLRRTNGDKREQ